MSPRSLAASLAALALLACGGGDSPAPGTPTTPTTPTTPAASGFVATVPTGWGVNTSASGFQAGVDTAVRRGGARSATIRATGVSAGTFGSLEQTIRADAYRGRRVRLSASVRASGVGTPAGTTGASLWLKVSGTGATLAFDGMTDRALHGTADWTPQSIVVDVPPSAAVITLGAMLIGPGQLWVDDLRFETVGSDVATTTTPGSVPIDAATAAWVQARYASGATTPANLAFDLGPVAPAAADTTPLRAYGDARGRWVGAATGTVLTMPGDSGARLRAIVARDFSMLWTGTYMKFDYLRPTRATFNWAQADSVVAFAQRNRMVVRGHTLVWHSQVPAWVTGGGYPADTLKAILQDHVQKVVTHFRGKLVAWDVVNEAMGDDAVLRRTLWSDALGPDYIEQAFRWARAADPDVALYYNDYNIETVNAKSDAVYALLRDLRARGVPIDGVGFQFHYLASAAPSADATAANFARFAALGLKIQITEADMHVPVTNGVASPADQLVQATAYANVVVACLRTPACNAIEIEGIYDGQAWVSDPTRWGAPVLYDVRMQPKPAYYAVQAALRP